MSTIAEILVRNRGTAFQKPPITETLVRNRRTAFQKPPFIGAIFITIPMARQAIQDAQRYIDSVQADSRALFSRGQARDPPHSTPEEQAWFDQWTVFTAEWEAWIPERIGFDDPKQIYDETIAFRKRAKEFSRRLSDFGIEISPRPDIPEPTEFKLPNIPWTPILIVLSLIIVAIIVPPIVNIFKK